MTALRTEFPFLLPKGLVDAEGVVHREGTMRLATARDELEPLNDPKVRDADDPYLTVIVLARVVTRLGTLHRLSPRDVEQLFAADLAYLQDVYATVNYGTDAEVAAFLERERDGRVATARGVVAGVPDAVSVPSAGGPSDDAPVSAAAHQLLHAAPATLVPQVGDDHIVDEPEQGPPAAGSPPPRRARIEEVGRSIGRPGGA